MKRLLFILTVLTISSSIFAQFKLGGALTIGSQMMIDKTKTFNNDMSVGQQTGVGINVRGDYSIGDKWSVTPGFTFVFSSSNSIITYSAYQFNVDGHYVFASKGDFNFYGLAGINYIEEKWDGNADYIDESGNEVQYDDSDNKYGINIGVGTRYKRWFGELKYDSAFDEVALSVGILIF